MNHQHLCKLSVSSDASNKILLLMLCVCASGLLIHVQVLKQQQLQKHAQVWMRSAACLNVSGCLDVLVRPLVCI